MNDRIAQIMHVSFKFLRHRIITAISINCRSDNIGSKLIKDTLLIFAAIVEQFEFCLQVIQDSI